ncbi:FAD-dependent oxidoreductase [Saccharopolyspora erythraea]|uniref:FAD-dependent oxidoreductase n=1 Tax=Saccharopolyspora erythraea TaxID=1836 RepID=UPI001BAD50C6|nr:FAD-dependent oxidoreductase [Saccharopolyspora erythraea]
MPTGRRVLIVGAGIAGLATALRLRRSGWQVVVLERAPGLRDGGYMLNLGGLGYEAAERLGILPELRAAEPEPFELVHVDEHGRRLAAMDPHAQRALVGDRMLALFRGDIERVLRDALGDGVDFRFGTTVESISQATDEVSVELSDGTTEVADLVVGADGLHSRVRSLLFGAERGFRHDFGALVAISLLDEVPAAIAPASGVSLSLVDRGVSVVNPTCGRSAAFFIFGSRTPEADLADGAPPVLRRRYADLGWVVPDLLDAVEGSESVFYDQVSQIRLDRWSSGRVVLLGDSAWCVSLFAGYGASLALGGAELLGTVLERNPADIPGALRSWERLLRPVAERRRRQGRRLKSLFVASNSAALHARTQVLRLSGSRPVTALMRRFLALDEVVSR